LKTLIWTVSAVVLAAAAGYMFAPGVGAHGRGPAAIYNTATETSISGTLAQPPSRGRMGLYLSVQSEDGEMVDVRVAPRGYLAARGFTFAQGDEVEITGSRVMVRGAPVLIAREVTKQGRTVPVRDRDGRPLWR